jgi:hypothetical protein
MLKMKGDNDSLDERTGFRLVMGFVIPINPRTGGGRNLVFQASLRRSDVEFNTLKKTLKKFGVREHYDRSKPCI